MLVSLLFMAYGFSTSGLEQDWQIQELGFALMAFALIAAVYGAFIALPIILLTEWQKVRNWKIFAVAGGILGLVLSALFTEIPFRGINYSMALTMVTLSLAGAMLYWFIAWHLFPPKFHSDESLPK